MTETVTTKNHKAISIQVTHEQYELIKKASDYQSRPMASFTRLATLKKAQEVVEYKDASKPARARQPLIED